MNENGKAVCNHPNRKWKASEAGLGQIEICPDCHKLLSPVVVRPDSYKRRPQP